MRGGTKGTPLKEQYAAASANPGGTPATHPVIGVEDHHTGEEVIAAASGPGAGGVHGFFPNTRLFEVLMAAVGWARDPA